MTEENKIAVGGEEITIDREQFDWWRLIGKTIMIWTGTEQEMIEYGSGRVSNAQLGYLALLDVTLSGGSRKRPKDTIRTERIQKVKVIG